MQLKITIGPTFIFSSMAPCGHAKALWRGRAQENGTVIADDRPWKRIQEDNWNDHTCLLYKEAVYNVTAVAAPAATAAASA